MKKPVQSPLFFWLFLGVSTAANAQKADSATTAFSGWQHMRIQRSAVSRSVQFTDSFTDNRHQWPTGSIRGFTYSLESAGYSMRRTGKHDGKSGRAFISLPDSLNLNRAATFMIEVEMVVPKGTVSEGGLLLGVGDNTNYSLFVLRGQTEFMLKRVVDGTAVTGDYEPVGKAVAVDPERNVLRIEKHDGRLFFIINGQDIPGDAVAFRKFDGNGIGFISSADAVTFRNLRVTVGL